jgi:hypothetical protein
MPTCVARGPELEIEIPSKIQVAIPSQSPRRMTIFTVHWSKDDGCDETHRINPVVAVAKARQLEASGYRVALRIAGAAGSRPANSISCSTKPQAALSARDFSPA